MISKIVEDRPIFQITLRITNFCKHSKAYKSISSKTVAEMELMPHYVMVVTSKEGDVGPIVIQRQLTPSLDLAVLYIHAPDLTFPSQ